LDRTLSVYSDEYAQFIRNNHDSFANPVGMILKEGLAALFEAVVDGADPDRCRAALLPIVRLRAVQDIAPSQALAFVPQLKNVVREMLREKIQEEGTRQALSAFEGRVDQAALLAFDLYSECRERIFELRVNEMQRSTAQLRRQPGAPGAMSNESVPLPCRASREPDGGRC
jgi:hypothetical protein